jgi:flagellar protein FlgJ
MDVKGSSNWFDFGSLANLRAKADRDPSAAKSAAAQQFESLFLNMMMKEMRKTVDRSGLLGSDAMETYEQMFDQQVAIGMSKAGGVGLAKYLEQQMTRNRPGQAVAPSGADAAGLPINVDATPTEYALGRRSFNVKGL